MNDKLPRAAIKTKAMRVEKLVEVDIVRDCFEVNDGYRTSEYLQIRLDDENVELFIHDVHGQVVLRVVPYSEFYARFVKEFFK